MLYPGEGLLDLFVLHKGPVAPPPGDQPVVHQQFERLAHRDPADVVLLHQGTLGGQQLAGLVDPVPNFPVKNVIQLKIQLGAAAEIKLFSHRPPLFPGGRRAAWNLL